MGLVQSLLAGIAEGLYVENRRFVPRRRIEAGWGVSNKTAVRALDFLAANGFLQKKNRKLIVLAADSKRRARVVLRALATPAAPFAIRDVEKAPEVSSRNRAGTRRPQQQTLLHERLVKSLLVEIAGGAGSRGRRFLSLRTIRKAWGVSNSTAELARSVLLEQRILRRINSRLTGVAANAADNAALLLAKLPDSALPPPGTWKTKRNRHLYAYQRPGGYRLAVIHPKPEDIDIGKLAAMAASPSFRQLNARMFGQRDLVAFLHEAMRHQSGTQFFRDDGTPETARDIVGRLLKEKFDGVAIFEKAKFASREVFFDGLRSKGVPTITVYNNFDGLADASVECNEASAGYTAMRVLLDAGHADVLVIHGRREILLFGPRHEGAMACFTDRGTAAGRRLRTLGFDSRNQFSRSFEAIFSSKTDWPTAILALDVALLRHVDPVLRKYRVRIPDAVSLIACGPAGWRADFIGNPDVMDHDMVALGRRAALHLIKLVRGDPVPRCYLLPSRYVRRGTVGRSARA